MRQSTLIVEIGSLLGDLAEKLRNYDQDYSTTDVIKHDLQLVKQSAELNDFDINFQNLQHYRSGYMPERGESFIEKNGFLRADLEDYLEGHKHDIARTVRFFANPYTLRGPGAPGMSRFFDFQVQD